MVKEPLGFKGFGPIPLGLSPGMGAGTESAGKTRRRPSRRRPQN
jgi:hypothetical protein